MCIKMHALYPSGSLLPVYTASSFTSLCSAFFFLFSWLLSCVQHGGLSWRRCGGAFSPSDIWMQLCYSLINTGTGTVKVHITHFLTYTQRGVQSLERQKKPKLYCTLVCDGKMTIHVYAEVPHILCFFVCSPAAYCRHSWLGRRNSEQRMFMTVGEKKQLHCGWQDTITNHENLCTIQEKHFKQSISLKIEIEILIC